MLSRNKNVAGALYNVSKYATDVLNTVPVSGRDRSSVPAISITYNKHSQRYQLDIDRSDKHTVYEEFFNAQLNKSMQYIVK